MFVAMGKTGSTEEGIAKPLRLALHHVEDFNRIVPLRVVLDQVALFGGDDHADFRGPGGNHAFHQILGYGLGALHAVHGARAYWQQLLGTAQGLYALAGAGCGNDADHGAASLLVALVTKRASSRYCRSCRARTWPV